MKASKLVVLSLFILAIPALGGPEVDRLLAGYAQIETVACQIRRNKEGEAGKMTFLSRVYWTNKNQIHSEGITPFRRRTIADGERLYQYMDEAPKGFSRPIGELSEQMALSLQLVPGTAMEHLLRLRGCEEAILEPEKDAPKRVGIQLEDKYVVLRFDGQDRLIGVEFYRAADRKEKTAAYEYSHFVEAAPGAWVPMTHRATVQDGKIDFKELVKVDRFVANKPVADSLFIAGNFFDKGIDFVDDFAKIFPE